MFDEMILPQVQRLCMPKMLKRIFAVRLIWLVLWTLGRSESKISGLFKDHELIRKRIGEPANPVWGKTAKDIQYG